MPSDEPDTHTVTTPVTDELRHALALPVGLEPAAGRVVGAGDGDLGVEGEEVENNGTERL